MTSSNKERMKFRVKLFFLIINGLTILIQFNTELMVHLLLLNMELKQCLLDQLHLIVFILFILGIWNMILNTLKSHVLLLLLKIHKCLEECKIEDKILLFILLLKLNLLPIVIQTILFLKLKDLKSLIKSSLLVVILILGILDHKLEPMMMEEDSLLFSKLSECWRDLDSDQEEPWDSSLGADKNLEVKEMEQLNIFKDISTK